MSSRKRTTPPPILYRMWVVKALFDCIEHSEGLPHVYIDATYVNSQLPPEHRANHVMVLNVSTVATRNRSFGEEVLSFKTRLNGVTYDINLPYTAILVVYDKETGEAWELGGTPEGKRLMFNTKGDPSKALFYVETIQERIDTLLTPAPAVEPPTAAPAPPAACTDVPEGSTNVVQLFRSKRG